MRYRGRFAPSPTGALHFGSLVAALASWLCARQHAGAWLLRIDDIDPPREVPGSGAAMLAALDALGLHPDEPVLYQSMRVDAYASALQQLRDAGHAFPCWCSRSDLEAAGAIHRDGHCVASPRADRAPAWRLHTPDVDVAFDDALQGRQRQNVRDAAGDFVLKRADGLWSYQLACIVDDAYQGITEVVRGRDLLDSTPRQILLQRLLGLPTPAYLHLPLAVDGAGRKLSKSSDAPTVDLRERAEVLRRGLAFLGQRTCASDDAAALLDAAVHDLDLAPLHGIAARNADDHGKDSPPGAA